MLHILHATFYILHTKYYINYSKSWVLASWRRFSVVSSKFDERAPTATRLLGVPPGSGLRRFRSQLPAAVLTVSVWVFQGGGFLRVTQSIGRDKMWTVIRITLAFADVVAAGAT